MLKVNCLKNINNILFKKNRFCKNDKSFIDRSIHATYRFIDKAALISKRRKLTIIQKRD